MCTVPHAQVEWIVSFSKPSIWCCRVCYLPASPMVTLVKAESVCLVGN